MTQQQALTILRKGHNVFLTGPAGSGKTYVLNKYITDLKNQSKKVGITASTGIAATHLGGTTIHSWSGLGIKDQLSDDDIAKLLIRPYLRKRIQPVDVLIIDEVSMLHAYQLDLVDRICRLCRHNQQPFGGLQIILCGDLFQLPPVSKGSQDSFFITAAQCWQHANIKICYLEEQFRQTDSQLDSILQAIRSGDVDEDVYMPLQQRIGAEIKNLKVPTKLYSHNVDVDTVNTLQLQHINNPFKTFDMRVHGQAQLLQTLVNSCLAPERLVLKLGAQVMFVKNNFDQGYVNGTLGTIVDWDSHGLPVVSLLNGDLLYPEIATWKIEEDGRTLAEINQLPLRLAWAITIHKSQGMSLDAAEVDLGKSFVPGMGYVALSRVRTLDGLTIQSINNIALQINEQVLHLDQSLRRQSEQSELLAE